VSDLKTHRDLAAEHGVPVKTLKNWWLNRAETGHPASRGKVGQSLAWNAEEWAHWYRDYTTVTTDDLSRDELAERSGVPAGTLATLWQERKSNGHPPALRKAGRLLRWHGPTWLAWYEEQVRSDQPRPPDRSGDPDDLITLAEAARVMGMNPTSITMYPQRPPKGWPPPRYCEDHAGGTPRRRYLRRDIWEYDRIRRRGYNGGRPEGALADGRAHKFEGDPRLDIARAALRDHPAATGLTLASRLAHAHGGAPGTWTQILTVARHIPGNDENKAGE